MDPITAVTTFSTLVSLLSEFVSHRNADESKSLGEFMDWLSTNRHEELRSLLEANTTTSIGIKALLGESQREILDRLHSLDKALAGYASGFKEFREIAELTQPALVLSEQAISLLEQFNDSGASKMLEHNSLDGMDLVFIDGRGGELKITEGRFLQDDLNTLLELGLLDLSHNSRGTPMYLFKRSAAKLVSELRAV